MRTVAVLILAVFSTSVCVAADVAAGATVYNKSCKGCHGGDGVANPSIAKMMKVEMKDLGSADVQVLSDADLKGIITSGKGKMKPVTSVTGAAVDNVVAYVRSLKK